jgi:transposase-like protein
MSEGAFPYSESLIGREIGVSRGTLRSWRGLHLEESLDWQKNGAEILLSEDGVKRVAKLAGVSLPNLDLTHCLAGQKKNGAMKKMTVVPPMPINPRVVLAEDDAGKRHLVDVGRNETFVFGDELEVGPHAVQQGIWRHLGDIPRDRRRPIR